MFLPRPKCRCVASMIPGKIAMFSSLIKVPTLCVDDTIQFAMLQVFIVCKTLLLIVCRRCATVDRRNVAAFVQYTRWLVASHKSWLLAALQRLLLAASQRSLVPASQGSLVIICRALFLIVCRCCATVAAAALRRLAVDISRHWSLFVKHFLRALRALRRFAAPARCFPNVQLSNNRLGAFLIYRNTTDGRRRNRLGIWRKPASTMVQSCTPSTSFLIRFAQGSPRRPH